MSATRKFHDTYETRSSSSDRQAEGLTRKHSKDLCRKKLGSNRRKKQQHKLALHHETTNRRKDSSTNSTTIREIMC